MKIVLPDSIDILDADKAALQRLGQVTLFDDIPATDDEIIRRIADAELITASWVHITAAMIQRATRLHYIVVPSVGWDHVDVEAAHAANIVVCHCPTHNALAVAEYTIGLIFAITRRLVEAHQALKQGHWDSGLYQGMELRGKTLGLIGYGTIGREVVRLAKNLGMEVMWSTSKTAPEDLDRLIANVDILSLHLPLTHQSHHLLDERRLQLMKPTAYLINTARGAIADQQALLTLLKEKRIAGAALDVFDHEPLTGRPSEEILELAQLDNVIATPHIAFNTYETAVRLAAELTQTIQSCLEGKPINVVSWNG